VDCGFHVLYLDWVLDYIDSSKSYECVNTESISDIEYYNTNDGYKIVNFINVDSKIYVMVDKTIPINDNIILLHPDNI